MAVWATTLVKAAKRSDPPSGLTDYTLILRNKILDKSTWKLNDKNLMNDLVALTGNLSHSALMDVECLAYVIKCANVMAKGLDDNTRSIN